MKAISSANQAALAARRLLPRDFLRLVARNRSTGNPVSVDFWSDLGNVTALVIDPETGNAVSRDFYGAGALIQISDIPAIAGITVQRIDITMSQLDDEVAEAVRLYDLKQGRVEIHTGLLDPDTRKLVDPAEVRFIGFVDEIRIATPAEGGEGGVVITCTSHTQELARTNPETRSHADQRARYDGDDFFIDAAVCGDWQHHWGAVQGKSQPEKPKGLFGWGNFLGFL